MKTLLVSLKESDSALLPGFAKTWGVDPRKLDADEIPGAIEEIMCDPEYAGPVWDRLTESQRGIMQTLLGGINKGRMALAMFEPMYGEIRKMGKGAIEREKPLENPASDAEALFYRGFIFEGYEQTQSGIRSVVYVPPDFAAVLPMHRTSYDDLDDVTDDAFIESGPLEALDDSLIEDVQPADTTIIDDMTTLLAYLQVAGAGVDTGTLSEKDTQHIIGHLLNQNEARLEFLFGVGISGNLIEIQEQKAYPRRAETRRWLEATRVRQLKILADAWLNSTVYRDLWQVPGLHPEPTGWSYDPVMARKGVLEFMQVYVPQHGWWSVNDLILILKGVNPDFQRPGSDYDSWYIRNDNDEYLKGIESWDAVEGSLIEFYLYGPLHWLALTDLAEEAVRLTAFGRPFVSDAPWPKQAENEELIRVEADGTLYVSRRVSRFERFQAMRFTSWLAASPDEGYIYKLNAEGIRSAATQGIHTGHIAAFIKRMLSDNPVPEGIARLLETWKGGATAGTTLERLLVLRTTDVATMDYVLNEPGLRRYLRAQLGPMAVVVDPNQWNVLRDTLGEHGIMLDVLDD